MNDQTDQQLLRDYTERQSDAAFAVIVQRYVDLVYSAALRLSCDAHTAKDVTQGVFVALAQNARQLTDRPALAGWLHGTARNLAIKAIRSDVRRRAREQEAVVMNELLSANPDASWEHIAPYLDEALGELSEPDRDAVLLRYFKNHDLRTVGATLGISDDAAQKRVSRAVERLREFFAKRGVTAGASGLAVLISANAVQAAPVGLALTISAAAALTGTTLATATTITATKAIAMTALQKTIVTATIAVLVGAGIYEARQASQLRDQVETLQQQQAPLAEQIQQLQNSFADATNRLANLLIENNRLTSNPDRIELLKLRGEVARLRSGSTQANDPSLQTALDWVAKKEKLKKLFAERADWQIPELRFLKEENWLDLVKDLKLDSADDVNFAMHHIRTSAKMASAWLLQGALKNYIEQNNGNLPTDPIQLKSYASDPIEDEILQRYRVVSPEERQVGWLSNMVLVESTITHKWQEQAFAIGTNSTGLGGTPPPLRLDFPKELVPAMKTYQSAASPEAFKTPDDFAKLKPYVTTPEQGAALDNLINALKAHEAP